MQRPLIDLGGKGVPLLLVHANGYPPGSYRALAEQLATRYRVLAVEHRPLWGGREPPRPLRWALFTDDLLGALRDNFSEPVWLLGHSMGGSASILAAHWEPDRVAGLLLLDPVVLPDRLLLPMRLLGERRRMRSPLVQRTLRRPERFPDLDAAFAFYREKRAFRAMSDEALWDYVRASKEPTEDGGVQLRFSPAWEAAIYGSVPRLKPALKRMRLPTLGLRGRDSDTLLPVTWARWARWQPGARLEEVPGGHLFPMEHPEPAASVILSFLSSAGAGAA